MTERSDRSHGGVRLEELEALGIHAEGVVDFSVNLNFYGPHPEMAEAIRNSGVGTYPDPDASAVRRAIAKAMAADPSEILPGNGSADLFWRLALAFRGATALVVEPTFSEFRAACEASGVRVEEWRARSESGFDVDVDGVSERLRQVGAEVAYFCLPNNPTGSMVAPDQLQWLCRTHPRTTFIWDLAFLPMSDQPHLAPPFLPNTVHVCSLTKAHGIPGVRIGYLRATPARVADLQGLGQTWATGSAAQAAAIVAVRLQGWVEECRRRLLEHLDVLATRLRAAGHRPRLGHAPFLLLPVESGAAARRRLLDRGVLVRDCASFGLPKHLRLAARPDADVDRLLSAMDAAAIRPADGSP